MTAKTSKLCTICELRPRSAAVRREGGRDMTYCDPCYTLAGMENDHSDFAHESPKVIEAGVDETGYKVSKCWVCHPELDESAADYKPRVGTSRAGMAIHVTLRASGRDKAAEVAQALGGSDAGGLRPGTTISVRKGIVTLKSNGLTLRWDVEGRYLYAESSAVIDGKTRKVRNVSEALRLAA